MWISFERFLQIFGFRMLTDPQHPKQLEEKVKVKKEMENLKMMVLWVLSVVILHLQVWALPRKKELYKDCKSFVLRIYMAYTF